MFALLQRILIRCIKHHPTAQLPPANFVCVFSNWYVVHDTVECFSPNSPRTEMSCELYGIDYTCQFNYIFLYRVQKIHIHHQIIQKSLRQRSQGTLTPVLIKSLMIPLPRVTHFFDFT